MLEKFKSERVRPSEEYWRRLHAWATKAIEESRYRPTGLADVRANLLNATEALEKAGRNTLADDIKQQLRLKTAITARTIPSAFNQQTIFETYLRCLELEKGAGAGGATESILTNIDALLGSEAKFNEGTISSLSVGGDAGYMQISVPVHPGNSGGALLNRSGDVVGVVIATASALNFLKGTGTLPQNVSWAVKGAFAVPLFDSPPPSPRITDRGAVVRRAVKATCSVTASAEPN